MKELSSEDLDRIVEKQVFYLPYFRAMLRAVEQRFYEEEDLQAPILDLGAGDGHFAWALSRRGGVLGLDPWYKPLVECAVYKVYPLLILADGKAIPAESGSFATAMSNSVLEHIPGVQAVLNEVGRCLKSGGRFLFAVPNQRFKTDLWGVQVFNRLGLKGLAERYSRFFNRIARHHNLDDESVWIARLKEAGFSRVEYRHYFPVKAMQMLERGHVAGLPNLLWKKLFGKWVLFPSRENPFLRFKMVRHLIENPYDENGCCTFYVAWKD